MFTLMNIKKKEKAKNEEQKQERAAPDIFF